MALTRITSELITDGTISTDDLSSTAVTSISGSSASSSFSSRITLVEDGTTTKTLISSSAQIASDISGSFTAGTGLDLSSGELSVDVSDFMANGSNNRIITATGTDGQNAEANLTFDGSTLSVTGDTTITGDATIQGTLTAQEIHTEFESASIIFTSGSTIFGNSTDDTHFFSGSVAIHNGEVGNAAASSADDLVIKNNGDAGISVLSPNGNSSRIQFGSPSDNDIGHIGGYYNSGNEYLFFSVDGSTRMVIGGATDAGNVGIGITNPASLLTVAGDNKAIDLRSADYSNVLIGSAGSSGAGLDRGLIALRENGSNNTLLYGDGIAYFGGAVTSSLLLVEGVSNYQGIEIKGSGASRPQLKFRNVNQGDLGQIYGTEGNDLTIIAADDLILDATGEHIHIDDGGTRIGNIDMGSQNLTFRASVQDKDIIFRGQDGSSEIEAMRIDFSAAGAVGIGTDAPDSPLHVYGNSADLFRVQTDGVGVGDVNPGTYAQFHVRGAGDTSVTGSEFFDGYGDDTFAGNPLSHTMCLQSTTTATRYMGPSLIFRTKVGTTLNTGTVAAIVGSIDETPGSGVENRGALRFFTCREYNYGPEFGSKMREAMYIDYAQRVGIGTNNLGANLHVRTPYAGSVASVKIDGDDGTNDAGGMLTLAYNTAGKWNILSRNQTSVGSAFALQIQDADGNDGVYMNQNATSFTSNSDERMKENIVELENATDKLNTLRCVNFTMKHDSSGEKRIGLIAQDVYKVYPEVTTGSPDVEYSYDSTTTGSSHINAMGLQYTELVAPMIKAIQELSSQIGVLKAQISGSNDFSALKTSVSGSN